MKYFKCENCGAELTKNENGTYSCAYCKRTYYDDSLEKAYDRVYQNLRGTVQGIVSEELLKQKIEQIATCRQALYKECNEQFVDNTEIERWAGEILKLSPKDAQANFYFLAAKKRWSELNKFMQKLNAREVPYLVDGFVDYLTNGQFAEKCVLCLSDLIDRAFDAGSEEYAACHKKIVTADERERSGIFDVSLPRDVFVAYSSKDKEKAYELVEYLEKNGFTCFIAMRNLAKGVDAALKYNERLKTAMDSCRVFLLVSSTNSRARDCDAYRIEMQYIRDCDCKKANDFALASARYEEYLEKNRSRCKPRVEYLIEEYGSSPYEKIVKKFFGGLTWCRSLESVSDAVFELIESAEVEESQEEKFARERAEFEAQKAELARKEQELSRNQNTSAPSDNIDDLYKAFKERERAETEEAERKRKEEEERKRREEEERKRHEEERKRQEESIKRDFEIVNGVLKKYKGNGGSVAIPNSVTSIGRYAFNGCTSLTSVTIPNSVTLIGDYAFKGCASLTSVTIPNSVTLIEVSAFEGCKSLASVTIPNSVTSINGSAFEGCTSLTSVTIPDSVTYIGGRAFNFCNLQYSEYDNAKYLGNENNKYLILVKAKATSIESCIIHEKTKLVGGSAFGGCTSLTSVTIPNSVTSINGSAFEGCKSLTSVTIPDSVTYIGWRAFNGCTSLTSVTIPDSVTSIGGYAFNGCTSLTSVTIPDSVTSIEDRTFEGCTSLTSVTIPDSVTSIDVGAFKDCTMLARVTIPDSITSIKDWAFKDCKSLAWVNLPDNVKISDSAFDKGKTSIYHLKTEEECKRKEEERRIAREFEIVNGELKKYKGNGGNVTIPNSVTSIGVRAFEGCKSLTSVTIPNSVTAIGASAFSGCTSLTSVTIPDSITSIWEGAFAYCERLTSITIPNSVTQIGPQAFWGCSNLTSVTIPNSVTSIENETFHDCSRLKNVIMSDSVNHIGPSAFSFCSSLTSIRIPNNIERINYSMFEYCTSLESVVIPNSVKTIAESSFRGCSGLKSITIPESVKVIAKNAFKGCDNLTIYTKNDKKPAGWEQKLLGKESWNPDKRPVKWGVGK